MGGKREMAVKSETPLQERIQNYIVARGGKPYKNHGDMISKPGQPDITCCYRGLYIAIEAKVDDNEPSRQQGIECREIMRAGGITLVAWSVEEVKKLLNIIDNLMNNFDYKTEILVRFIIQTLNLSGLDDGGDY